jgi:hypothetical protein
MAIVRNASDHVFTLVLCGEELHFVPQQERPITAEQLASDEFQRAKDYFVVTEDSQVSNIPEQQTPEVSVSDNEPVKPVKKAKSS